MQHHAAEHKQKTDRLFANIKFMKVAEGDATGLSSMQHISGTFAKLLVDSI